MKRIILKKVNDLHMQFQAKRFVTNVWRGYECISLETVPSSVCVAKGAFIAKHQTSKMLLPVLGENVQKLLNLQEQDFYKEIMGQKQKCEQLEEICDDLMGFRQRLEAVICKGSQKDEADKMLWEYLDEEKIFEGFETIDIVHGRNLVRYYWQEMISYEREEAAKYQGEKAEDKVKIQAKEEGEEDNFVEEEEKNDDLANLLEKWTEMKGKREGIQEKPNEAFQCEFIRRFFEGRGSEVHVQEALANGSRKEIWEWFQETIQVIGKYRNLNLQEQVASHPKINEFKNSLWGHQMDGDVEIIQKNMINYVMKHTSEKLSEKQIRNCYERLMDDMLECVLETETEEKKKYSNIDSLF